MYLNIMKGNFIFTTKIKDTSVISGYLDLVTKCGVSDWSITPVVKHKLIPEVEFMRRITMLADASNRGLDSYDKYYRPFIIDSLYIAVTVEQLVKLNNSVTTNKAEIVNCKNMITTIQRIITKAAKSYSIDIMDYEILTEAEKKEYCSYISMFNSKYMDISTTLIQTRNKIKQVSTELLSFLKEMDYGNNTDITLLESTIKNL